MSELPQRTEKNGNVLESHGGFSPFYYALLRKHEEEGFSGLMVSLAYGKYKAKKQEEIEKLCTALQRAPSREELAPFVEHAIQHVDLYILDAEKEQEKFAAYILAQLEIDTDTYILDAAKNLKDTTWYQAAWFGALGNIFFFILTTFLAYGGMFGEKFQTVIKSFF